MKKYWLCTAFCLCAVILSFAANVEFKITGLHQGDKAIASIVSNEYVDNLNLETDGIYSFGNVPVGSHSVKIEAIGYQTARSVSIVVDTNGNITTSKSLDFNLIKLETKPDGWSYTWQSDDSPAGYTTTAYVNNPPEIEFLGKKIVPSNVPFSAVLLNEFKRLSDNKS